MQYCAPLILSLFCQVKSVEMAAQARPFPLEYGTNFAEKCVPGGCKFPAAKQRNVLELLCHVKGLHLSIRAGVCEFALLLGNYLQDVPTDINYNRQLSLYRRVLGLDRKFRAEKHALQKSRKFNPAWGAGCNQTLQDLLQAEFRVAAQAAASFTGEDNPEDTSEEDCCNEDPHHMQGRTRGCNSAQCKCSDLIRAQEKASKERGRAADLQKRLAEVTTEKVTAQRKATFQEHRCEKLLAFQPLLESKDLLGMAAQVKDLERDLEKMKAT